MAPLQRQNIKSMADVILENAGYNAIGELASSDSPSSTCGMSKICKQHFDTSSCDPDNCQMLVSLREKTLPDDFKSFLSEKLNIEKYDKNNNITIQCPRSLQAKATINKNCNNKKCPFYSHKMAFSCMILHGKIFFPEIEIPFRVKQVATQLSERVLNRYDKISIYLIRIYLIIFKYCLEHLHLDYRIDFQTKYIFNLLQSNQKGDFSTVEFCRKCGGYVKDVRIEKVHIKNSTDLYEKEVANCCCSDPMIYSKRIQWGKKWYNFLDKERFNGKKDINKLNYKKLFDEYGDAFFSKNFIAHLISHINVCGVYLKDIPLGYAIKAYMNMFGVFDPINFGIGNEVGQKFLNLFVGGILNGKARN